MTDKPLRGTVQHVLLWEKASYIAIGQYTDDDIKTRINEILTTYT